MKKVLIFMLFVTLGAGCLTSCSSSPEGTQEAIITAIDYITEDLGTYAAVVTTEETVADISFKNGYYAAVTEFEIDGKPVVLEISKDMAQEWAEYLTNNKCRVPSYKIYSIIGHPTNGTTDFEQLVAYYEECLERTNPDAQRLSSLYQELDAAFEAGNDLEIQRILREIFELENQEVPATTPEISEESVVPEASETIGDI